MCVCVVLCVCVCVCVFECMCVWICLVTIKLFVELGKRAGLCIGLALYRQNLFTHNFHFPSLCCVGLYRDYCHKGTEQCYS